MYGTMYHDHWHSIGYFHSYHPSDTNTLSYQSGVLIARVVSGELELGKCIVIVINVLVLIHSGN